MKAEFTIFPLHYRAGVDSTSIPPPRTIGGKFDNLEELEDFRRRSILAKYIPVSYLYLPKETIYY